MESKDCGKFDLKVLAKLNTFLQKWRIAPAAPLHSDGAECFYFVRVLEDDDFADREYEQYQEVENIPEWEALAELTLFKGQFYRLANDSSFYMWKGKNSEGVSVPVRDTVSRCYREGTKVSVVDILRHAACISFDPMINITGQVGLIDKVEIDTKALHPTLVFNFECS